MSEMNEIKYRHLRYVVLCRLALFNARRGGEMAALKVDELSKGVNVADYDFSITNVEQRLIHR